MQVRVYPRVCGGTRAPRSIAQSTTGLSPRVRGTTFWASVWVYPLGLSPRVRGNRAPAGYPHCTDGSIPACAGEPRARWLSALYRRVYPRVCGGTRWPICTESLPTGLSPRVRGNLLGMTSQFGLGRSIPACAGEPASAAGNPLFNAVYPRVCGGTAILPTVSTYLLGLSPRVRGNRVRSSTACQAQRSIPACAGEPRPTSIKSPFTRVYPRVCGGTAPSGE